MEDLFNSLFNPSKPLTIENTVETKEDIKEFRPSFKKGTGDVYDAVIRFLPNPQNPAKKSVIMKWVVFLRDPATNTGKYIDDPATVNEDSPLSNMYFALKKSGIAAANKLSDNWKRKQQFYSLVQVLEDKHEPQLKNKILVWKYGIKVFEKILAEQKSPMPGIPGGNPFDLFAGKVFAVHVTNQSNFNNFDGSAFLPQVTYPNNCMRIPINGAEPVKATKELAARTDLKNGAGDIIDGKTLILKFLTDNAPHLSDYEFKHWSPAITDYVKKEIGIAQQVLSGQPITPAQTLSNISEMSLNQPSVAADVIKGQPQSLDAAFAQQTAGFGAPAQSPAAAPAPAQRQAQTPANPIAGLNLDAQPAPQQIPATPAQQIGGLDMSAINSILPQGAPAQNPATAPSMPEGLDIDAIINAGK